MNLASGFPVPDDSVIRERFVRTFQIVPNKLFYFFWTGIRFCIDFNSFEILNVQNDLFVWRFLQWKSPLERWNSIRSFVFLESSFLSSLNHWFIFRSSFIDDVLKELAHFDETTVYLGIARTFVRIVGWLVHKGALRIGYLYLPIHIIVVQVLRCVVHIFFLRIIWLLICKYQSDHTTFFFLECVKFRKTCMLRICGRVGFRLL